jgi:hypothetical protein
MALRSAAIYDRERADAMDRWAQLLESGSGEEKGSGTNRVKPDHRT